jgi:DNA-binding SARP family transcriptional activator
VAVAVVEGEALDAPRFDVRLLGPVDVIVDGVALDLGGSQPRAVIAHLALDLGRVVPVERLVARLWGEFPPTSPLASLQTTLSRLRRLIEPDRAAGTPPTVIVSEAPGYALRLERDSIDLARFRDRALEGRRAAAVSRPQQALAHFDAALAEWRGAALGGLGPEEVIAPIAHALEEERLAVVEDRFDAVLALGQHAEAVAELSAAVNQHPLRERLWSTLAVALYRSQRQADALRAIDQARRTLIDELGLDPGPDLQELERRILDHDPALLAVPTAEAPVVEVAPATRSSDSRFVGRTREWARLTAALDRAAGGAPALVLLDGEPGIGKSALAERLLEHASAHGWRVAVGRSVDGELAPALWPIIELARDIAGEGALHASPTDGVAVPTPVEIADAVLVALDTATLDSAAGDSRWCLFVDDLHWADRLTLDVFALLCERLGERRVLVIGAFRPPATAPDSALFATIGALTRVPGSERIAVPPLDEDEVAAILQRATGAEPAPDAVRLVHARAGGNPFFVGELARLFGEEGVTPDSGVPDAVRDVVRARLAPLPPITKTVLQVAAVAGERVDLQVLIEANGLDADACLDALDPAIVARMLVTGSDHELRFAHAIVRDAVLADIAVLQRSRLHRSVADAIERTRGAGADDVETIARHRLASLPIGDPVLTAQQLVEASNVARWRGALDSADELAEQALGLVATLPRRPDVDAVEHGALDSIAANEGKRSQLPAGADMATRIDRIAQRTNSDAARMLAIYVRWWATDIEPLERYADLAVAAEALASRSDNRFARILGYHVAGLQAFAQGRLDEAAPLLDAALAAAGADDPDAYPGNVPAVHTPGVAAFVAQLRGDQINADIHATRRYRAWHAPRLRVDPTVVYDVGVTIGFVAAMRDDAVSVRRALSGLEFDDLAEGVAHLGNSCAVLEGWAAAMLGDADGAGRAVAALDRLDRTVTIQIFRPALRTFVGAALLQAGDSGAVDVLARADRDSRERGEVWWLGETLRLRGVADARFGDGTRSAALFAEARELAQRQGARLLVDRIDSNRR